MAGTNDRAVEELGRCDGCGQQDVDLCTVGSRYLCPGCAYERAAEAEEAHFAAELQDLARARVGKAVRHA